MGMTTTTTPVALWRALCSDAALELRLMNGKPGRDADVEAAIRAALSVPTSAKSLEKWLVSNPQVTVEQFLVLLLKCQVGFGQMMQDIVVTLARADAGRASRHLSIAFKFHDMDDPIVKTLEQFRKIAERTQKVLETRPVLPDSNVMWAIAGALRTLVPGGSGGRPVHFPVMAPLPSTGVAKLDESLGLVTRLVVDIQDLWKHHGIDRPRVLAAARAMSSQPPELAKLRSQLYAASDFWDNSVIDHLQQLPTLVASGRINAEEVHEELSKVLSSLEWGDIWVDQTFRELLDILALPTWQRRHELYSVWVGTRLLEVARKAEPSLRFNTVEGILSFAFGGSRLATYERQGKEYEIWAELRSALIGSSTKRKEKIQPDFRVVQTGLSPVGARTVYVLECKHYLRSSKSNFTTAAKDYARSCPGAFVHVVNHGPANNEALRAALPESLRTGVGFIGEATPEVEVATGSLCSAIREVLFPVPTPPKARTITPPVAPLSAGHVCQIFLEWDASLDDMDLALHAIGLDGKSMESIAFDRTGAIDRPPFACFDTDVRHGPGVERIDIATWQFEHYELVATNYSESGHMTPEALQCRIVTPKGETLLRCPAGISASSHEWRIADLTVRNDQVAVAAIALDGSRIDVR